MLNSNVVEGTFKNLHEFKNLMKLKMKYELHWSNQMKIIVAMLSYYLGYGMFEKWNVWDVRCSVSGLLSIQGVLKMEYLGCEMFGMLDFPDVECLGVWIQDVCDVDIWDVGYSSECAMLIHKMPKNLTNIKGLDNRKYRKQCWCIHHEEWNNLIW